MSDVRITCIQKLNPSSPHEHITHVGNPPAWVWTREAVIKSIKAGNSFYVLDPLSRKRSEVGVVEEAGKEAYLRTHADGYYNNNLLSLNQCSYG